MGTLRAELDDTRRQLALAEHKVEVVERNASDAFQRSEVRYRQLVEVSPEPIFVHVDRRIVCANLAGARMVGLTDPGELLGRSIVEFGTPATQARIEARMATMDERREPLVLDQQSLIRVSDGREVHFEITSIPIVYDRPGDAEHGAGHHAKR